MDRGAREAFLAGLPAGLASATTAAQRREAATPPPQAGISYGEQSQQTWVEGRLVSADAPQIIVGLDPPVDARELASLWGIERPVAVSGDVHQQSWWLLVGGRDS